MPDFNFTVETSVLLIELDTITSLRKLVASTACPDRNFVWLTSDELTEPLAVVSPRSTPIGTLISPMLVPSLTPLSVTVMRCALVTPVRSTVIVVVPLPVLPLTDPAPTVTAALVKVTELGKVNTIW